MRQGLGKLGVMLQTLFFLHISLFSQELAIQDYKGKVLYVDFWASWCTPCALSFPWMKDLEKKYSKQGLQIVTINLDEEKKDADRFLKKMKATSMKVIFDPEGHLVDKYQVESIPTSVIFDRKGKKVSQHSGFTKEKGLKYEKEIKVLLKK